MMTETIPSSPLSTETIQHVLVVIPTLNEGRTIEGVLSSLNQGLPMGTKFSFVVVDGGSRDDTVERVQRMAESNPDLRCLHNPRRIQSAAVNLAVQELGRGVDVLVRCDAHAEYPDRFLAKLLHTLEQTQADSVVVPMDSGGTNCFQKAVAWTSNTWAGTGGSAHRGGRQSGFVDHGHHAAFRMASFQGTGGYDEGFTHNEDAEFDCRLGRLGGKVFLDAENRLGYHPRGTVTGLARQYFFYGRGRSRTVRKHPGSMRARQLAVPLNLVMSVLAIGLCAWMPWLLIWPLSYVAALGMTSISLAWRHRSACGLLSGFAAGVMHTSWALGFFNGLLFIRERPWKPEVTSTSPLGNGAGAGTP